MSFLKDEECVASGPRYTMYKPLSNILQFNVRICPSLQNKAKAKEDALAAVRAEKDGSPDKKRPRVANEDKEEEPVNKQNELEPFKPPYVPELFVGSLEGLEGEEGMSILVSMSAVISVTIR